MPFGQQSPFGEQQPFGTENLHGTEDPYGSDGFYNGNSVSNDNIDSFGKDFKSPFTQSSDKEVEMEKQQSQKKLKEDPYTRENPYRQGKSYIQENPYTQENPYEQGIPHDQSDPYNFQKPDKRKGIWLPVMICVGVAVVVCVALLAVKGTIPVSKAEPAPVVEPTPTAEPTPTVTPTPTKEPDPTPVSYKASDITASLINKESVDMSRLKEVAIVSADSSSIIEQDNVDNRAICVFDNNTQTDWQEGVDGPGIGESVTAYFDETVKVHYILLKLGNWKTEEYFYGNNRPSKLGITIGDFNTEVQFPDTWEEFCVELNHPYEASSITFRIDDVYKGISWDDTAITDVRVLCDKE